jgi:hypothetical protein
MFADYQVNLVGQLASGRRAGCQLSFPSSGTSENDLLNLPGNWMKNIVASGFFL